MKEIYIQHIAGLLGLKDWQVENCAGLFEDGDTIPFISRYRKEKTGGMDDVEVAEVRHWVDCARRSTAACPRRSWKTSTSPGGPSGAPVPRWPANWAWSRLRT